MQTDERKGEQEGAKRGTQERVQRVPVICGMAPVSTLVLLSMVPDYYSLLCLFISSY